MGEWLDITTAPKDGTHILACFNDPHQPYTEHWTFNQSPPAVVHWFEDEDFPGFFDSTNADDVPMKVTHWQPLPDPPRVEAKGG